MARFSSRRVAGVILGILAVGVTVIFLLAGPTPQTNFQADTGGCTPTLILSESEWADRLTPAQYHILREGGTERAFTGAYWDHRVDGWYHCTGCNATLFASSAKFNSGTGWPSFTRPVSAAAVCTEEDTRYGLTRVEVRCSRCGGHLGHVFEDGPTPTGLRYCINSVALAFVAA